jgi:hypothetical protein
MLEKFSVLGDGPFFATVLTAKTCFNNYSGLNRTNLIAVVSTDLLDFVLFGSKGFKIVSGL